MICPCCDRGIIGDDGICTRCKVGVPASFVKSGPTWTANRHTLIRYHHADRPSMYEYILTKMEHTDAR